MNPLSTSPAKAPLATPLPVNLGAVGQPALYVEIDTGSLALAHAGTALLTLTRLHTGALGYRPAGHPTMADEARWLLAALEGWLTYAADTAAVDIEADAQTPGLAYLVATGLLQPLGEARYRCHGAVLWQHAPLWLPLAAPPYPQRHTVTDGRRHPHRPPRPSSTFYRRFIPWIGQTLTFEPLDPQADLALFNRWMNTPRVTRFWNESGSLDDHRRYLDTLLQSPHSFPVIGRFDGVPFGYFEIYWAREDRIAPYYEAGDYDRGVHLLVGEEHFRGQAFYTAWFSSLCHFALLDDPRTQRVVCEPSHDNRRQLANFDRSGFAKIKSFDFPHKRATLVMLSRERFFQEHLFHPLAAPQGAPHFSRS